MYPKLESVKRICVAKLRHHGDVLLMTPVLSSLKERFPDAKIDAYIYAECKEILDGHPALDALHLTDKKWKKLSLFKRLYNEWRLLRSIKKQKYDLFINLTEGDRGALAARISKAKIKVGIDPEGSGMKGKGKWFTHLVKHCPKPRHTVEKNLDALRVIGILPESRDVLFHVPESTPVHVKDPFVLIHPVSRWMFKTLPEKTIADLITWLLSEGKKVVLTSSPNRDEMNYNKRVMQQVDGDVLDLSGQTSIKELGALVAQSEMVICVDSLPLHMTSAFKKPVVVLFGPTCDLNWAPHRNPYARVVSQKMSCRPCYRPGCGGSGISDCLVTLPVSLIKQFVFELIKI